MSYDKELVASLRQCGAIPCGVAEPLLQAELLLYTVVYCELDHRWHWIGCITCNAYAVTNVTACNTSTYCEDGMTVSWLHIQNGLQEC